METEEAIKAIHSRWYRDTDFRENLFTKILKQLKGIPHKRIRAFAVINTAGHPRFDSPTVIFHVPGGRFRGFSLSYKDAVKMLQDSPDCDDELVNVIWKA